MNRNEIQNLISGILERTVGSLRQITISEDKPGSVWVSIELEEPHFFIAREGEGLHALNHLVHRIIENQSKEGETPSIVVDVNGFQKKRVGNIRAVAHMMSERARYFKSNIEVEPMSAFERRIVHEFLADAEDLETESIGAGRTRRVVIKYIGKI